ncbi:MAG TPA: hypothetical protein EYH47_03245 [Pseudomonas oleovorans]|nr:hypothetical protein [Pseudomonas oleovorans]
MEAEDFPKETSIKITLGHLLLAWEVLSNKFSDLQSDDSLSDEERRAIWGLADLLENSLAENGVNGKPQAEWAVLISKTKEYMNSVPVDFLE